MNILDQPNVVCATADESLRAKLQIAWRTLRTLTGDDAYEQYCAHFRAHHGHEAPLTRREFYIRNQHEKWNGVKRCC